jgi:Spy/CpxP family protein refolding chaperone
MGFQVTVRWGFSVVPEARRSRVMRALIMVVAGAVLASLPGQLAAEEKADQKATKGLAAQIQDLFLSDEQEAKIADIQKGYRPRVQAAGKELVAVIEEELDKILSVLTLAQKTKIQAFNVVERQTRRAMLRAERLVQLEELDELEELEFIGGEGSKIAEIRKEYRPRIVKPLEGLMGTLDEGQRKAREEALKAGKKRSEMVASLNLSDEQNTKIEAVGKEVGTAVREALEKIRDAITEGEKEKRQELEQGRRERVRDPIARRIMSLKDLKLTDTQRARITEIGEEYRPRVQKAADKLGAALREEVEKIIAVLKG